MLIDDGGGGGDWTPPGGTLLWDLPEATELSEPQADTGLDSSPEMLAESGGEQMPVAPAFLPASGHEPTTAPTQNAPTISGITSVRQDWTVSIGVCGNLSMGVEGVACGGVLHLDDEGNLILGSFTLGIGGNSGANPSLVGVVQVTDAANVDELKEWYVNTGVGAGEGVVGGIDAVFGNGSKGRITGIAVSGGAGAKVNFPFPPVSIHGNANYTWLSPIRLKLWNTQ